MINRTSLHGGRRPPRVSRILAALVVVVGAGVVVPALRPSPGWANTESTVKLKVGQTVKLTLTDLTGEDGAGQADFQVGASSGGALPPGQNPSGCDGASNPSCDDIPITLDVPKSALHPDNNLFLQTIFTYDTGGQEAAPTGTYQNNNSAIGWLWENPIPSKGPNAGSYDASCSNDPCEEGAASPQVAKWNLVIDQQTGSADPVKVTITLSDVAAAGGGTTASGGGSGGGGGASPSGSGATSPASPGPSSGSSFSSGSGGGSGFSASPPVATPGFPGGPRLPTGTPASFSIDTAGPNASLAALASGSFGSELGIGAGNALRTGQFFGIPLAHPASTLAVVLSLVAGPLVLAGVLVWLARRRRAVLA